MSVTGSGQATKASYLRTGSAKKAADVKSQYLIDYLCTAGPGLCPRCPSRCAYGQRYLDEVLKLETENNSDFCSDG